MEENKRKSLLWRWIFFLTGLMVMSLGVSMTIKGHRLGIAPWDVLHVGLYQNLGLTIGSWSIITGFIIILSTSAVMRKWPKIGTWINMVLMGLFIDLFNWLLPDFSTLMGQVIIYVIGVLVLSYGVGIYVSPNMGAGPRDSLMLILVKKWGFSIKAVRTGIEMSVAFIGWLLGGPVGVGTVLIALLCGQIIQIALPQCQNLLLKILKEEDEQVLLK
ncbi:YitT family protein [Sporosarcina sp. 179-K 3D1 HS]|uniref:YczE/YyaS/YitT family protein n=1 Tax=Sporosarcina sp. 179-K 3D1 HS TaxID=3232169 RepID=UPI0039A38269